MRRHTRFIVLFASIISLSAIAQTAQETFVPIVSRQTSLAKLDELQRKAQAEVDAVFSNAAADDWNALDEAQRLEATLALFGWHFVERARSEKSITALLEQSADNAELQPVLSQAQLINRQLWLSDASQFLQDTVHYEQDIGRQRLLISMGMAGGLGGLLGHLGYLRATGAVHRRHAAILEELIAGYLPEKPGNTAAFEAAMHDVERAPKNKVAALRQAIHYYNNKSRKKAAIIADNFERMAALRTSVVPAGIEVASIEGVAWTRKMADEWSAASLLMRNGLHRDATNKAAKRAGYYISHADAQWWLKQLDTWEQAVGGLATVTQRSPEFAAALQQNRALLTRLGNKVVPAQTRLLHTGGVLAEAGLFLVCGYLFYSNSPEHFSDWQQSCPAGASALAMNQKYIAAIEDSQSHNASDVTIRLKQLQQDLQAYEPSPIIEAVAAIPAPFDAPAVWHKVQIKAR